MKIKNVNRGQCLECGDPATKNIDNVLYCSRCADIILMKQIGQCIKALEHVKITIKVIPKKALEASRGDKKRL